MLSLSCSHQRPQGANFSKKPFINTLECKLCAHSEERFRSMTARCVNTVGKHIDWETMMSAAYWSACLSF